MATPKRPLKKTDGPVSPLDVKRRALLDEERQLQEAIARQQRLIEDAPKIAREQERRRREELVARASRTEGRLGGRSPLPDPRYPYEATTRAPGAGPRLKREQRRGMLTFFVLLLILIGVVAWLYFTVVPALRG